MEFARSANCLEGDDEPWKMMSDLRAPANCSESAEPPVSDLAVIASWSRAERLKLNRIETARHIDLPEEDV
jgi:hypothetical protein